MDSGKKTHKKQSAEAIRTSRSWKRWLERRENVLFRGRPWNSHSICEVVFVLLWTCIILDVGQTHTCNPLYSFVQYGGSGYKDHQWGTWMQFNEFGSKPFGRETPHFFLDKMAMFTWSICTCGVLLIQSQVIDQCTQLADIGLEMMYQGWIDKLYRIFRQVV